MHRGKRENIKTFFHRKFTDIQSFSAIEKRVHEPKTAQVITFIPMMIKRLHIAALTQKPNQCLLNANHNNRRRLHHFEVVQNKRIFKKILPKSCFMLLEKCKIFMFRSKSLKF